MTQSSGQEKMLTNHSDNLVDECPICCMVFASTMTEHQRYTHVDEHFH